MVATLGASSYSFAEATRDRLAAKDSSPRVQAAAERALATGACRYNSIESILKNSLDPMPLSTPARSTTPPHDNIRGAEYFE